MLRKERPTSFWLIQNIEKSWEKEKSKIKHLDITSEIISHLAKVVETLQWIRNQNVNFNGIKQTRLNTVAHQIDLQVQEDIILQEDTILLAIKSQILRFLDHNPQRTKWLHTPTNGSKLKELQIQANTTKDYNHFVNLCLALLSAIKAELTLRVFHQGIKQ